MCETLKSYNKNFIITPNIKSCVNKKQINKTVIRKKGEKNENKEQIKNTSFHKL